MTDRPHATETDSRFPSGEWVGFYLQQTPAGNKHPMDLALTFREGRLIGQGRDIIAKFDIRGRYDTKTDEVTFHKHYLGLHSVLYHGWNEGKGIWGKWEIASNNLKGGFHIWPKGMADPTIRRLRAERTEPVEAVE